MGVIDPALKAKAKQLYFEYQTDSEIVRLTGVQASTLSRWINGRPAQTKVDKAAPEPEVKPGWRQEREAISAAVIKNAGRQAEKEIAEVFSISLPLIKKSLKVRADLLDEAIQQQIRPNMLKYALCPKAIADLSHTLTNFHKLMQLAHEAKAEKESGATAVGDAKAFSVDDLLAALQQDQFLAGAIPLVKGIGYDQGQQEEPVGSNGRDGSAVRGAAPGSGSGDKAQG